MLPEGLIVSERSVTATAERHQMVVVQCKEGEYSSLSRIYVDSSRGIDLSARTRKAGAKEYKWVGKRGRATVHSRSVECNRLSARHTTVSVRGADHGPVEMNHIVPLL